MVDDLRDVRDGKGLHGLQESLLSTISKLRLKDLSVLEIEILARLIGSRRTTAELVSEIYGTSSDEEGYRADYYRVRRATKSLEERGFVSAPLFGKMKPFHLTRHAVSALTSIGVDESGQRVVRWRDVCIFALTLVSAGLSAAYARSTLSWTLTLPGFMLFFSGVSVCRMLGIIRSVM